MKLNQAKAVAKYGICRRPPEERTQFTTKDEAESLRAFAEQMVDDFGKSRTYWLGKFLTPDTGDEQ